MTPSFGQGFPSRKASHRPGAVRLHVSKTQKVMRYLIAGQLLLLKRASNNSLAGLEGKRHAIIPEKIVWHTRARTEGRFAQNYHPSFFLVASRKGCNHMVSSISNHHHVLTDNKDLFPTRVNSSTDLALQKIAKVLNLGLLHHSKMMHEYAHIPAPHEKCLQVIPIPTCCHLWIRRPLGHSTYYAHTGGD